MKSKINITEISKSNPKVNKDQLNTTLIVLRQLQKMGIEESKYNLITPFKQKISHNNS